MATETDAARDRVLAARAALGDELDALEASARAAIDVPAKVRRSPAKAAAVAGSVGFLLLGGPNRLFRAAKRAVSGPTAPLPKRMLPDEIEKTLRELGDDGDKVRGALERDFAGYARQAAKARLGLTALLTTTVAKPLLNRAARTAGEWLFRTDDEGFAARLAEVRDRAAARKDGKRPGDGSDTSRDSGASTADDESGSAGA